jgi:hypothetical protein
VTAKRCPALCLAVRYRPIPRRARGLRTNTLSKPLQACSRCGLKRAWNLHSLRLQRCGSIHGHILPRQISIFEDARLTVTARVDSREDAHDLDANLFKPAAEMVEAGGSFTLTSPNRFPMRVDPSDAPTSTFFQPLIVHAILDAQDGRVLDAETLQNSDKDLSRAAMAGEGTAFPASGFQQEVFINVQFHLPSMVVGGPPTLNVPVVWVVSHGHKVTPVRKPPSRSGS